MSQRNKQHDLDTMLRFSPIMYFFKDKTYHDLDATLRFSPIMNFFKDKTYHDWTLRFASLES
ncbi:hypothetical protein H9647_05635 [Paenibacillus sp. Sa2BVA9]|uniref:Uncharacterized protein n=1 Tax=Paenibacillus gallinarum TaxID=2762232 RepID=A0ABR8SVM3_9BACL|nr:hypothetical protein [Paenibacillus gallinarum]